MAEMSAKQIVRENVAMERALKVYRTNVLSPDIPMGALVAFELGFRAGFRCLKAEVDGLRKVLQAIIDHAHGFRADGTKRDVRSPDAELECSSDWSDRIAEATQALSNKEWR